MLRLLLVINMEYFLLIYRIMLFFALFRLTYPYQKDTTTLISIITAISIIFDKVSFGVISLLLIVGLENLYHKAKRKDKLCLVKDGELDARNFIKEKYSMNAFLLKLKDEGIKDLNKIKYAFIGDNNELNLEIKR